MGIAYLAVWTLALLPLAQPVQTVLASEGFSDVQIVSPAENSFMGQNLAGQNLAGQNLVAQNSASSTTALENSVFQQINQYRKTKGLSQLSSNATITQQARRHSQDMANSRVLSHDGFNTRVSTIGKSISYSSAAENVAYNMGYTTPDMQAVQGWLKSPGHRQNIEGDYNLTGIGVVKNAQGEYYFTQIFIKRRG